MVTGVYNTVSGLPRLCLVRAPCYALPPAIGDVKRNRKIRDVKLNSTGNKLHDIPTTCSQVHICSISVYRISIGWAWRVPWSLVWIWYGPIRTKRVLFHRSNQIAREPVPREFALQIKTCATSSAFLFLTPLLSIHHKLLNLFKSLESTSADYS